MFSDRDIGDAIRSAGVTQTPLRIVGAGTWLDAGGPVTAAQTLSLAGDRGIVAYTPGDLTITARAGTTLAELDDALRVHGQWLALDPAGERHGTIGATVATASYGPLAAYFGTPRDQVLGLTVVTGTGDVIQPGGGVVKNVAGFDLVRLMVGAWGTLGVITQVTLRVRARGANDDASKEMALEAYAHMRRDMPTEYGHRVPQLTNMRLSLALQRTFDPFGILNPGIMQSPESQVERQA